MTAATPPPVPAVTYDVADKANPVVLVRFTSGSMQTDVRIDARQAESYAAGLAGGIIAAARQALAECGPQLITPRAAGDLLVPGAPR